MPIVCDITSHQNNQRVGPTVCVVGSYSGEDGTPFVITCTMKNSTIGVDVAHVATIDTQEGTWQATFTSLPESEGDGRGSYTISASATGGPVYANPITGVEVTTSAEISVDQSEDLVAPEPGKRESIVPITGTYSQGYGLANGYIVNARLTLGGKEACSAGRLYRMKDGKWEYRFRVCPRNRQAMLHVELWRVNAVEEQPISVVVLTRPYSI